MRLDKCNVIYDLSSLMSYICMPKFYGIFAFEECVTTYSENKSIFY